MNLLTRFVNFFKPKQVQQRRSYAAAATSRLLNGFAGSLASPDSEMRMSLPQLRARSRELARNNDYVRNALRIIRNNVVGQGIPFQAQVRKQRGGDLDQVMNDSIESLWYEWSKAKYCHVAGKYSFQEIEAVIMNSIPKNGEVFIRIHRVAFGGSKVPLSLEILRADMLDECYNVMAPVSGNEIRMGVELDVYQRPVAYWFHSKDPGDWSPVSTYSVGKRVRVDAKDIIHLFVPEDEQQTRAVPWFASAMVRLHHMQGFEEATIVGQRARASLMGFIETPEGELTGDDVDAGQRVTDFEPGVFKQLNAGETVNVPNLGGDNSGFDPFMKAMLRGVSAGIGISYESLSKDYAGATYSSARQALLEDRDVWRNLQQWMIRNFHQRILEEWMGLAYLSNALSLPLYGLKPEFYHSSIKWMPRGWTWIDPLKEVEASKLAVRAGFMTVSDVVAQTGNDYEETLLQRKREIDQANAHGVNYETDPNNDPKLIAAEKPAPQQQDQTASKSAQVIKYFRDQDGFLFRGTDDGIEKIG